MQTSNICFARCNIVAIDEENVEQHEPPKKPSDTPGSPEE
jgi:hypothetical protein